jgi:cyclase
MAHFTDIFKRGNADGALAAGIFHYGEMSIPGVKQYLADHEIPVRIK